MFASDPSDWKTQAQRRIEHVGHTERYAELPHIHEMEGLLLYLLAGLEGT